MVILVATDAAMSAFEAKDQTAEYVYSTEVGKFWLKDESKENYESNFYLAGRE